MILRTLTGPFLAVSLFLISIPSFGQKKKKPTKPTKPIVDTNTVFHDYFSGNLIHGTDTVGTLLQLDHKLYHDMGTYVVDEVVKKPGGKEQSFPTYGDWTVLRETLNDTDITVVELTGPEEILFFYRKNDSTLQKMNAQREALLEPFDLNTLRKIPGRPVKKDSLTPYDNTMLRLCGTYRGKLPCADCSGLLSTLTLRFRVHAKGGDYTLNDKYTGTKSGDINNDSKGRWTFASRPVDGHNSIVIILDPDKPGRERYYLSKKEGVVQVDKNGHHSDAPGDQTLRRQ